MYFKDSPESYLGITADCWNIGKKEPAPLHALIVVSVRRIADFYSRCFRELSIDDLNAEIQKAVNTLSTLRFESRYRESSEGKQ